MGCSLISWLTFLQTMCQSQARRRFGGAPLVRASTWTKYLIAPQALANCLVPIKRSQGLLTSEQ
jgi:hypothetical protein